MKKILSLVLALAMILTLGAAFAADETYETPLTVTGLETNDVAHFYKVIEWVGETEDNSDVTGWKAVAPFDTYLTKAVLTAILVGTPDDPATEGVDEAVAKTGITSEIAGKLASLATGEGTPIKEQSGTATLNNDAAGMWMAIITPANATTVYNPVFVSSDYLAGGGTVNPAQLTYQDSVAKKSTLTLTKTASNANDYNKDNANTTAVGDTVTFTVNTTIPAYGSVYENPHFVVKDTLTDLALNVDSVEVTAPSDLKKGTDYTVDPATAAGYTLTFSKDYLKKLAAATNVTITYTAVVTSTAQKAINEEDNEVVIEYSHNPNDESDYDVQKDTTQHYTFTLDADALGLGSKATGKKTSELVKIGLDGAGNPINQTTETSAITSTETWKGPLAGAVFGLFTDAAGTVPYKGNGDTAFTATTGADGRMKFTGLDAGTYYLKEISAPTGYVTNTTVHTIEIIAELEEVTVTEYYKDGAWSKTTSEGAKSATYKTNILKSYTVKVDNATAQACTFTNEKETNGNEIQWEVIDPVEKPSLFENIQGVELPSTGGIGTTIFYVLGGLLVVGAAIVLVARRKAHD